MGHLDSNVISGSHEMPFFKSRGVSTEKVRMVANSTNKKFVTGESTSTFRRKNTTTITLLSIDQQAS